MIKRPKPTDTEDDILKMQNEFLGEKKKKSNFQPAAKLVKVEPSEFSKLNIRKMNRINDLKRFFFDSYS